MKMKKLGSFIATMLTAVLFQGCSCSADNGVTYTALYNYDAETLNYMDTNKSENADVFASLVDGLVETDKYGTITPALASSWEQDENDGTKWTFHIREGVKWVDHNGEDYADLTANDWVTSMKYAIQSDEMNYLITMFIAGSTEYLYATEYVSLETDAEKIESSYFDEFVNPAWFKADKMLDYKFTLLTAQPEDWATNYGDYFVYDDVEEDYVAVEGEGDPAAAPTFVADKFYKEEEQTPTLVFVSTAAQTAYEAQLAHDVNFANVGVKAVDDHTLEYTTVEVQNYFVSVLLHSAYYPANAEFIDAVGFDNFGTSIEKMLYCGPHILKTWDLESRVVLVKNEKYWDAEHVYIDKVVLLKYDTTKSTQHDYIRKLYERGDIDGFSLDQLDTTGWKKYVTGKDGTGTIYNPANAKAYSRESEMGSGSSYLYFFNRNINKNYIKNYGDRFKTTLTDDEIDASNKALGKSASLRRALVFALDRTESQRGNWAEDYINIDQYLTNTYVPKEFAVDENGKDYFEHYVEYYAANFTKADGTKYTVAEATAKLQPGNDGITDAALAAQNFAAAKNELISAGFTAADFPIKLEFAGLTDDDSIAYDTEMLKVWNAAIVAACEAAGVPTLVTIVRNSAMTTQTHYLYTSNYCTDSIIVMGWGPDFADPLTYLDTLTSPNGAFARWAGINSNDALAADSLLQQYNDLVDAANAKTDASERLAAFAEAEYFAVYGESIVLPYYIPSRGPRVQVSNIVPYEAMKSSIGCLSSKYKHIHVRKSAITQAERNALKEAYDAGKGQ